MGPKRCSCRCRHLTLFRVTPSSRQDRTAAYSNSLFLSQMTHNVRFVYNRSTRRKLIVLSLRCLAAFCVCSWGLGRRIIRHGKAARRICWPTGYSPKPPASLGYRRCVLFGIDQSIASCEHRHVLFWWRSVSFSPDEVTRLGLVLVFSESSVNPFQIEISAPSDDG